VVRENIESGEKIEWGEVKKRKMLRSCEKSSTKTLDTQATLTRKEEHII